MDINKKLEIRVHLQHCPKITREDKRERPLDGMFIGY